LRRRDPEYFEFLEEAFAEHISRLRQALGGGPK